MDSKSVRGMYKVPSGEQDVHCARGVGVLVVGVATRVLFVLALVPLGVGEGSSLVVEEGVEEDKGECAKSCLAARKLLRSELVSSRLERYAPGLRIIEGPPETMLLPYLISMAWIAGNPRRKVARSLTGFQKEIRTPGEEEGWAKESLMMAWTYPVDNTRLFTMVAVSSSLREAFCFCSCLRLWGKMQSTNECRRRSTVPHLNRPWLGISGVSDPGAGVPDFYDIRCHGLDPD